AAGGSDGVLRLRMRDGATREMRAHGAGIAALCAAGDAVVTGGRDGAVGRWHVGTSEVGSIWVGPEAVHAVAAVPGSSAVLVATEGGLVHVDGEDGTSIASPETGVATLAVAPSGRFAVGGAPSDRT